MNLSFSYTHGSKLILHIFAETFRSFVP